MKSWFHDEKASIGVVVFTPVMVREMVRTKMLFLLPALPRRRIPRGFIQAKVFRLNTKATGRERFAECTSISQK